MDFENLILDFIVAECLFFNFQIFDMKKFADSVNTELEKAYPDRRKLESKCISAISFVKDSPEILDCPCWVMIINIVALDMLRTKLPPGKPSFVNLSNTN